MISRLFYPQSRYTQRCREENNNKNLRGKHVLVVGGTQGIGAAVARRFASLGCTVSIAGRNEALAKNVFWEMNLANPGPKLGKFYKVDLSSMAEVERFTNEVSKDCKDKGIDYLVLSAGGPPTGNWRGPTSEGLEKAFAVQCLSRFYTTYRLLPVIKESVVVIGSPGLGKFYDETDPGFEKPENRTQLTLIRQGRRDSLFLDAIFKEFSIRNPKLTFHHIYPGFVRTDAAINQDFHPMLIRLSRLASIAAAEPDDYADVPVATALKGGGGLQLTHNWGGKVTLESWANDRVKTKGLFDSCLKRAEEAAKQGRIENENSLRELAR